MKPNEYYCLNKALVRIDSIEGNTVTYMLYNDDGSYCKCIESIQSLIHFLGATK